MPGMMAYFHKGYKLSVCLITFILFHFAHDEPIWPRVLHVTLNFELKLMTISSSSKYSDFAPIIGARAH